MPRGGGLPDQAAVAGGPPGQGDGDSLNSSSSGGRSKRMPPSYGPARSGSGCWWTGPRTTPSSCSTRPGGSPRGTLEPSGSSDTGPTKSSASTSPASTRGGIDRGGPPTNSGGRGRGRFEDEGWRVRKDGTPFWANVVITALRDDAGHSQGFSRSHGTYRAEAGRGERPPPAGRSDCPPGGRRNAQIIERSGSGCG